jgi:hypothetical protein
VRRIAVAAALAAPLLTTGCTGSAGAGGAPTSEQVGDNNVAMACPGGTGMRRVHYDARGAGASSPLLAARPFISSGPGARRGDYGIPGQRRGKRIDILVIHQPYTIRHELIVVRRDGQWFLDIVRECASPKARR